MKYGFGNSEILVEERVSDCETMRRENRRVAAMSWGAGDDLPPPKPTRVPNAGMNIKFKFNNKMCIEICVI